MNAIHLDKKIN